MVFDERTLKRFWSKVDKRGPDECWPWLAQICPKQYGKFYWKGGAYAHRFAAYLNSVPTDSRLFAMHLCNNPRCVNPSHLKWGTCSDNMLYARQCGRLPSAKLNPSQVGYIKSLLQAGYKRYEIAKWYQIAERTVYTIRVGIHWADIPPYVKTNESYNP